MARIASFAWRERVAAAGAAAQPRVVADHRLARDRIADRPEAHHQALGAGQHEGAAEAVDALAVVNLAETGVARRQRDQVRAPEVQAGGLERRENPAAAGAVGQVRAGEGQPRSQQRVLGQRRRGRPSRRQPGKKPCDAM